MSLALTPVTAATFPPTPPEMVLTTFQSGHGWTASGGSASEMNDTTDYALGTQSAKITTNGAGAGAAIRKTGMSALDWTSKMARVRVKVDNFANLTSLVFYLGDSTFTNFYSVSFASSNADMYEEGEWVSVMFTLNGASSTGSPDLASVTDIQVRAQDDNTGTAVTLHLNEIAMVDEPAMWPNGVLSFAFDDGWASIYTQGKTKLDEYGFPATHYTIADRIGEAGYMTLAELTALQDGGWEIAAHAYTVANHNAGFATLTATQVAAEALGIKEWLFDNGFAGGQHFSYPLSSFSTANETALEPYFVTARLASSQPRETFPPENLLRIRAYTVTESTTTATIQAEIDRAIANSNWLILLFHKIVESPASGSRIEYSIEKFGTVVDYVDASGVPVRTVGDVYRTGLSPATPATVSATAASSASLTLTPA